MTLQIEPESLKNRSDAFRVKWRKKVEQELKEKGEDAAALTGVWETSGWTESRMNLRLTQVLCRKSSAGQDQRRQAWTTSQAPIGCGTMRGPIRARLAPVVLCHSWAVTPASRGGTRWIGIRSRRCWCSMIRWRQMIFRGWWRRLEGFRCRICWRRRGISWFTWFVFFFLFFWLIGGLTLGFGVDARVSGSVVMGQEHVVPAISNALRISRAGLQAPNRPVVSFLFWVRQVWVRYVSLTCNDADVDVIDGALQISCGILVQWWGKGVNYDEYVRGGFFVLLSSVCKDVADSLVSDVSIMTDTPLCAWLVLHLNMLDSRKAVSAISFGGMMFWVSGMW